MGNEIGIPASKMGITALAATTPNIEMKEFEKLLGLFRKVSNEKQSDSIGKDEFQGQVLKQMEKFSPPDQELFNQLFVLFDETGHDCIDYKAYLSGASVCLLSNPVREKLRFAFSVFDVEETSSLNRADIKKALLAINMTAAYFGDPVLDPKEIEEVTLQMSKDLNIGGKVPFDTALDYLLPNPTIVKFMKGEGIVRFGAVELRA
jgi:Ca2+-binding EF-hand superfamily protein